MGSYKAVDGEVMKLGQHVLADLHTPGDFTAQQVSRIPASGNADSSHPEPGGSQEVKLKGGGAGKHPEPGGAQEVKERFSGKVTLSGKHPID